MPLMRAVGNPRGPRRHSRLGRPREGRRPGVPADRELDRAHPGLSNLVSGRVASVGRLSWATLPKPERALRWLAVRAHQHRRYGPCPARYAPTPLPPRSSSWPGCGGRSTCSRRSPAIRRFHGTRRTSFARPGRRSWAPETPTRRCGQRTGRSGPGAEQQCQADREGLLGEIANLDVIWLERTAGLRPVSTMTEP